MQLLESALRADPLAFEVRRELAWVQVSAGRYVDAIDNARRVLAVDPNHAHTRQVMGRALFHTGETAEAIRIFEQLGTGSYNFRGYAYAVTGRHAEAEAVAEQRKDFPAALVIIYAGLGDKDRTFGALERMAAGRDPRVGIYLTYPELAFLRNDPRVSAFRRKLEFRAPESVAPEMAYNREHHRLVAATPGVLLLGPASLARAQSPSGAITGIVTDSSGAPLPAFRSASRIATLVTSESLRPRLPVLSTPRPCLPLSTRCRQKSKASSAWSAPRASRRERRPRSTWRSKSVRCSTP